MGLVTLRSFGAFLVDASPPVAGHVLDGDPAAAPAQHRDRDGQRSRTSLAASWEGFHDPHSTLVGYAWQAGTCPLCGDVVAWQSVGLDTCKLE